MAFEIVTEACGFQKNFDIARLAVAYDIKRVMSGKNRKCIDKSRINRSRCRKKCLMLFGTACLDQFLLALLWIFVENDGGDIREQAAEQAF